ncbi:hypothetical protein H2198_009337 [Neophaeococcomyces mojaviensis]|uniref:Uncharacterized protein n=1 Tax=Neophaeococcomyces mojaviensis TaxID=3383035 RepID=A0ACC2ZV00_9EURO|nr:hypothetical protein H2198_009337 [Knufia sp. JES_112]
MAWNSPRKRKASELENLSQQTPGRRRAKQSRQKTEQDAVEEPPGPYTVLCPADAEDPHQKGAFVSHTKLAANFETSYAVQPDTWGKIKRYRNVKLQDTTFTQGDIVYVCRHTPPPEPLPDGLTDREYLEFDKRNYWVAKIVEARATNNREVWLLVAWLYWPDEIPQDVPNIKALRQWYGRAELIMSNALDFVDATTISSKAEDVAYYDEWDNNKVGQPEARYWRQAFDAAAYVKDQKAKNLLSGLRSFCKCGRPHSPDTKMFRCSNSACRNWNHKECLLDAIRKMAWTSYQDGKMDEFAEQNTPDVTKSLANRLLSPVKAVGQLVTSGVEEVFQEGVKAVQHDTTTELHTPARANATNANGPTQLTLKKQGRPKKSEAQWQSKLRISIILKEDKPLVAQIEEKVGKHRKWEVGVNCLCCGKTLD